jgi:hypothetical protein
MFWEGFPERKWGYWRRNTRVDKNASRTNIPPSALCSHRLAVRTLASHAGNRGSIPRGSAKEQKHLHFGGVFNILAREPGTQSPRTKTYDFAEENRGSILNGSP